LQYTGTNTDSGGDFTATASGISSKTSGSKQKSAAAANSHPGSLIIGGIRQRAAAKAAAAIVLPVAPVPPGASGQDAPNGGKIKRTRSTKQNTEKSIVKANTSKKENPKSQVRLFYYFFVGVFELTNYLFLHPGLSCSSLMLVMSALTQALTLRSLDRRIPRKDTLAPGSIR
jgi:hypothetical protein